MSSLFLSPFAWAQSIAISERQELLRTVHPIVAMSSIHRSIAHRAKQETLDLDLLIRQKLKQPQIEIKYGKLHITSYESPLEFVVDVVGQYFRVLDLSCRPTYSNDCFTDKNFKTNTYSKETPEKTHFVFESDSQETKLVENFRRTVQARVYQLSNSEWGHLKELVITSASLTRTEILKTIQWDELSTTEKQFIKDYVLQCFNDFELESLLNMADASGDLSWLVPLIDVAKDVNDPHYHSSASLKVTFKKVLHKFAEKFEHEYFDFTQRARGYLQNSQLPTFLKLEPKEIVNFIGVEKRVETLFLKKFTEKLRVGKIKDDTYTRLSVFSDFALLSEEAQQYIFDWIFFSTDTTHFSNFLDFIERNLSKTMNELLEQLEFKLVVLEINNRKNHFDELHNKIRVLKIKMQNQSQNESEINRRTIHLEQFLAYLSGKPTAASSCSTRFQ